MQVEIKITVNKNGTATCQHAGLSDLDTSLILTQICVQLQANAIQQAGGSLVATPAGLPQGLRLS